MAVLIKVLLCGVSRPVSWGINRVCTNRNNPACVLQEEKESQYQMHHKQDDCDAWRWPWWEQGHVLLLTLRDIISLSCSRWPLSFVELQMLLYHGQSSQCFIVWLWYKHWNHILICKRNYDVGVLFLCSGMPSLGIWRYWLSSWSQICQTLPLTLIPGPGMLNWEMSKARNLCLWLSAWSSLRVAQSSLRELGCNNTLPDFPCPPSSCQADI